MQSSSGASTGARWTRSAWRGAETCLSFVNIHIILQSYLLKFLLFCSVLMAVWFLHNFTLVVGSTFFAHTRPSSDTSVCCCKMVHCSVVSLSETVIKIEIKVDGYKLNKKLKLMVEILVLSSWGWINWYNTSCIVPIAVVRLLSFILIGCTVHGWSQKISSAEHEYYTH
jgi:hypothetical protein